MTYFKNLKKVAFRNFFLNEQIKYSGHRDRLVEVLDDICKRSPTFSGLMLVKQNESIYWLKYYDPENRFPPSKSFSGIKIIIKSHSETKHYLQCTSTRSSQIIFAPFTTAFILYTIITQIWYLLPIAILVAIITHITVNSFLSGGEKQLVKKLNREIFLQFKMRK